MAPSILQSRQETRVHQSHPLNLKLRSPCYIETRGLCSGSPVTGYIQLGPEEPALALGLPDGPRPSLPCVTNIGPGFLALCHLRSSAGQPVEDSCHHKLLCTLYTVFLFQMPGSPQAVLKLRRKPTKDKLTPSELPLGHKSTGWELWVCSLSPPDGKHIGKGLFRGCMAVLLGLLCTLAPLLL